MRDDTPVVRSPWVPALGALALLLYLLCFATLLERQAGRPGPGDASFPPLRTTAPAAPEELRIRAAQRAEVDAQLYRRLHLDPSVTGLRILR